MSVVIPAQPFPVFYDPNQQSVHINATITTSSSIILTGYGASEISLFINVKAAPTGTTPTLQYTIQEVDPGDGATIIGTSISSTVINAINVQRVTLFSAYGGSIKISWTITGTSASFTQVYATLVAKIGTSILTDSLGIEKGTSTNPIRIDPTGTTPQPFSQIRPNSSTVAQIAASTSAVTLLASNINRKGALVYNDSNKTLYLKFGSGALATNYRIKLTPDTFYDFPDPTYTGIVTGIWTGTGGFAYASEDT